MKRKKIMKKIVVAIVSAALIAAYTVPTFAVTEENAEDTNKEKATEQSIEKQVPVTEPKVVEPAEKEKPVASEIILKEEGIAINETNFPDPSFRSYVEVNIDKDSSKVLSSSEINDTTEISASYKNISNLKGIEYFTALKRLDCSLNNIASLDVSKNTALNYIDCNGSKVKSIDVSKCAVLETLGCGNNNLTNIDVSKNTALKTFNCELNNLTSIDVSKNTVLETLWCDNNNLTSLDVSKNIALKSLWCNNNKLTSLDLSKCGSLQSKYVDVKNQQSVGKYSLENGKYKVDLTQFDGVNPDKVTVNDSGVKDGNIVTYNQRPNTMTYSYATGIDAMPMNNVVISFRKEFTVSFDSNGGSAIAAQKILENDKVTKPANPTKNGYAFVRWIDGTGAEYNFSTPVTSDITLYASWKQENVNPANNGDQQNNNNDQIDSGQSETGDKSTLVVMLALLLAGASVIGITLMTRTKA